MIGKGNSVRFSYIALACLLALVSVAPWGVRVTAEEDDVELLAPLAEWSDAQHISTTSDFGAFVPVIRASATGRLMIMYNHETNDAVVNPFYSQSNDGGDTWSNPAPVHSSNTSAGQVVFDFAGNTAHAVWAATDSVWHAREDQWSANGSTLIVDANEIILDPEVAAGPEGNIHVVWTQQDGHLYYSLSRNNGQQWDAPVALSSNPNERVRLPYVTTDQSGAIHIVWEERIPNEEPPYDPLYFYSIKYLKGNVTASDVNWERPRELARSPDPDAPGEARQPVITTDGNDLHVGFSRRLEDGEQYPYYISYSPSTGWDNEAFNTHPDSPVEVNASNPRFMVPTLTACNGTVHFYYHGAVDPNPMEQVLGASYEDTWTPRTAATDPGDRSIFPSMVCKGASLHLAYALVVSTVPPNQQIWYLSLSPTAYIPAIYK